MDKNEWYQVGEDIKRQVQQAIDTNDFSELSKSIGKTVGHAAGDVTRSLDNVSKSLNDAVNGVAGGFQQGLKQASANAHRAQANRADAQPNDMQTGGRQHVTARHNGGVYYGKPNLRPDPKLFSGTPKGSISGIFWMLAGFGMIGFSGMGALQILFHVFMGIESVTALSLPLVLAATGGIAGTHGLRLKKREKRFRRYVDLVKDKLYCSIEDLASKTGRSKRFVRRDLKRMMQQGMFLQAHMDKKESCFIASDAMYEQYMLTQSNYEQKALEEKKADSEKQENVKKEAHPDENVRKILEEGEEYIRVIRTCNDEIPGEEMSDKLDKLELLVTRIFARVEEEPEVATDLQRMLSYYLPTTQKLLEAYRDLDKQAVEGKNIAETKREIETTVDTINKAFEEFLDELFRDRAWDIQSDISVLNTMLKQDGYIKSDFEKGVKE